MLGQYFFCITFSYSSLGGVEEVKRAMMKLNYKCWPVIKFALNSKFVSTVHDVQKSVSISFFSSV